MRHYVYKVMYDSGGAPCVHDGALTLAICKPQIRRTARVGDWVYGFGGNRQQPANRLIFVGRVDERISDGDYYRLGEFADRPDAIYAWTSDGQLRVKPNAAFHVDVSNHLRQKDIGRHPDYENANVLYSEHFRYFGHQANDDWKAGREGLARAVVNLGQGHLVRHEGGVQRDLDSLRRMIFRKYSDRVLGHPPLAETGCLSKCPNRT